MKKFLLVFIGESFRTGGQNSRTRGLPESFSEQKLAAESHIDFLNHLKNIHEYTADISLCSYNKNYFIHIIYLKFLLLFLKI